MALIAGCQIKAGNIHREEYANRLRDFPILIDDDLESYENHVISTRSGYLFQKYKRGYPVPPMRYSNDAGNILITLGFILSPIDQLRSDQLEGYEGEFIAILAEDAGTLHIVNDRFASRPLYLTENSSGVYFSTNLAFLLRLAGGRHEADVSGWLNVFSIGHTYGKGTTFRNVQRLLPATHAVISSEGSMQQRCYWQLQYKPDNDLDPLKHGQRVFDAFREGAWKRSRLTRRGLVALSGGLDSRLVAAALPNDVKFSAFTVFNADDGRSSPDTEIASQVARVLGLKHHVERLPREDYSSTALEVTRLTGGLRPLHHAAVMPYVRELERCGVNFLLGGGPGDVSAGSKIPAVEYLDPARTKRFLEAFCRHLAGGADTLQTVFRSEIIREFGTGIYESLFNSFENIGGPTAAHRVTAWELLNRWPAFTFTSVLHNHPDVSEAFCHLDYQYADLMLQLPADWLYERNFYSVMIFNCLPSLRPIAYANTGRSLNGELRQFDYHKRLQTRVALTAADAARKIVPRTIKRLIKPFSRGCPSLTYSLYRQDRRLLSEIRECIHSLPAVREILDPEKCVRFLDDFVNDTVPNVTYDGQTELVGSLASFCLSFKNLMPE